MTDWKVITTALFLIFGLIAWVVIVFLGGNPLPTEPIGGDETPLPSVQPIGSPASVAECENLSTADTQSCCENWATSNQLFLPECIGSWTFANSTCSFTCNSQ